MLFLALRVHPDQRVWLQGQHFFIHRRCPVVAMEIGLFLCHLFFFFAPAFYTKFQALVVSPILTQRVGRYKLRQLCLAILERCINSKFIVR